ncbi:hypothetical protein [Streptomyces erythrochromogenes]|uniref:hypothetical protein n=1 Tax=Streptomyces erythrochromogenes TaxID=285574 RepID=UPI00368B9F5C
MRTARRLPPPPAGRPWSHASSENGLEIWGPVSGAGLGALPGFRPTRHDPVRGELVELSVIGLRHWRVPTGPQVMARS